MLGSLLSLAALAGSPVALPAPPADIIVPLNYASYADRAEGDTIPALSGFTFLECSFEPPGADWKLPELAAEKPLYGRLTLGDAEVLCVLDREGEDGIFYDRLYCDRNANRDLTDDGVILSEERGASNFFSVQSIDLELPVGEKRFPYCLSLTAYSQISIRSGTMLEASYDLDSIQFYARSHCGYSGSFEMAGETYRIGLGDGKLNGRFDDVASLGDESELDPDQALRPVADEFWIGGADEGSHRDGCPLGNRLLIAGRLWTMKVDFPNRRLTLSPLRQPATRLRLPMKLERLHLSVAGGGDHLIAYRPGEIIAIPQGECRPLWYQIYAEDEQGDDWYVEGAATPRTAAFVPPAGEITDLVLGPPFEPKAVVSEYAYESFAEEGELEDVRLSFFISGSGDDRVTEILHLAGEATGIELEEDGRRPKEPTYTIVAADGKRVASGAFRYG